MEKYISGLVRKVTSHPFITVFVGTLALFGYKNIFIFGYLINVPVALRAFLDGYFYQTLALEFFIGVAVAGISSGVLFIFLTNALINFPLDFHNVFKSLEISKYTGIKDVALTMRASLSIENYTKSLDRQAKIRLKLLASWMKRKK